jgi:hypothetical protein
MYRVKQATAAAKSDKSKAPSAPSSGKNEKAHSKPRSQKSKPMPKPVVASAVPPKPVVYQPPVANAQDYIVNQLKQASG